MKSDNTLVSEELNSCFQNATKSLNINENLDIVDSSFSINNSVDKEIEPFKSHPSILPIKQKIDL